MPLLHLLLACAQGPATPPKPISVPSPVRIPDGTVGVVRRVAGGRAEVVFPSIDERNPSTTDAPPPTIGTPPTLWVEWAGEPPAGVAATMDLTGLAWKVRCVDAQGTHFIVGAPLPEAAAPPQDPADDRNGVVGFVVVGEKRPGKLPPPVGGAVRRLEAANIAALDENEEATRTCASETDAATLLVTPGGRFRVGCCGP